MAIPQQKPVATRPKPRRRKRRRAWKDKHYRWVPDGQGDWRVQGYVFRHHHKPKRGHFRGPGPKPAAHAGAAAPAVAPAGSDPRPPGSYQGAFGHAQAVRLLQLAGFGPVPGQADQLVSLGLLGLDLFRAVTIDPAMLQWLNGNENFKWAPNENYAREMMELFSLGADRGAYSEDDIPEQARALTGWRNDWGDLGAYNFRFEPNWHDSGTKTVFGRAGNWGWEDACRLCVEHPLH